MFTVRFHMINNNNIQQMHLNTFIIYVKYSYSANETYPANISTFF